MTTYLVLSAVRIHTWLTRTPRLRYLRGASAALKDATARAVIEATEPVVRGRASWCDEAGEVSGVVALETAEGVDPARVADEVAANVREVLPAAELEAWWVEAPDYVTAFLAWDRETQTGLWTEQVGRATYLPAPADTPLANTCSGCRCEPVDPMNGVTPMPDGEAPEHLGPDCVSRRDHSEQPWFHIGVHGRPAKDFEGLAQKGGVDPTGIRGDTPVGRRKTNNHLATVSADGNGVGSFMASLASAYTGSDEGMRQALATLRRHASVALDTATSEALRRAIKVISRNQQQVVPVIVHLAGGDDIVVSVTAPLAWRFVTELGTAFRQELLLQLEPHLDALDDAVTRAEAVDATKTGQTIHDAVGAMSLGIGVAFAHESYPFVDAQHLAESAMAQAKKERGGKTSAVTWIDLTVEDRIPPGRCVDVSVLDDQMDAPEGPAVFDLPPHARAVLGTLLTDQWGGRPDRAEHAGLQLRTWAKRRTREDAGAAQLPGSLNPQARGPIRQADLVDLRDQLSRARWWPAGEAAPARTETAS